MPNFDDVLQFHQKMGLPVGDFNNPSLLETKAMRQRIDFMVEELMELSSAAEAAETWHDDPIIRENALAEIFDGLLDLVYVACGTGVMMGVPWEKGYSLVQEANMLKERVPGSDDEHHLGVRKPAGWQKPDIKGLIQSTRASSV